MSSYMLTFFLWCYTGLKPDFDKIKQSRSGEKTNKHQQPTLTTPQQNNETKNKITTITATKDNTGRVNVPAGPCFREILNVWYFLNLTHVTSSCMILKYYKTQYTFDRVTCLKMIQFSSALVLNKREYWKQNCILSDPSG